MDYNVLAVKQHGVCAREKEKETETEIKRERERAGEHLGIAKCEKGGTW